MRKINETANIFKRFSSRANSIELALFSGTASELTKLVSKAGSNISFEGDNIEDLIKNYSRKIERSSGFDMEFCYLGFSLREKVLYMGFDIFLEDIVEEDGEEFLIDVLGWSLYKIKSGGPFIKVAIGDGDFYASGVNSGWDLAKSMDLAHIYLQ